MWYNRRCQRTFLLFSREKRSDVDVIARYRLLLSLAHHLIDLKDIKGLQREIYDHMLKID